MRRGTGREPTEDDLHLEEATRCSLHWGGRTRLPVRSRGGRRLRDRRRRPVRGARGRDAARHAAVGHPAPPRAPARRRRPSGAGRCTAARWTTARSRSTVPLPPMREVEVLHDQLSRLFEEIPGLEPRDVVVMTPATTPYAPLVEAVPGETDRRPRLPSCRRSRRRSTDEIVDAFSRLLDVVDGRMTATDVSTCCASAGAPALRDRRDGRRAGPALGRPGGESAGADERHRGGAGAARAPRIHVAVGLDRLPAGRRQIRQQGREALPGNVTVRRRGRGSSAELLGRLAEPARRRSVSTTSFALSGRSQLARRVRRSSTPWSRATTRRPTSTTTSRRY